MLILPATVAELNAQVLDPLFQHLLPSKFDSPEARVLLLAIPAQEAGHAGVIQYRQQIGGPAHGIYQMEQGSPTHPTLIGGVLASQETGSYARAVCHLQGVAATPAAIYAALLLDDLLAAAFARLGLWMEPFPLPALADQDDAWLAYCQVWRPGRPRPDAWPANYQAALQVISP